MDHEDSGGAESLDEFYEWARDSLKAIKQALLRSESFSG